MKLRTATAILLFLLSAASAYANEATSSSGSDTRPAAPNEQSHLISIMRNGSRPSSKGSTEYFTGAVRIDPLFQAGSKAWFITGAGGDIGAGTTKRWRAPLRLGLKSPSVLGDFAAGTNPSLVIIGAAKLRQSGPRHRFW
jgi:hypothetical protein